MYDHQAYKYRKEAHLQGLTPQRMSVLLPPFSTCYSTMKKIRQENRPPNPSSLEAISFDGLDDLLQLTTGESMLLADNGPSAKNRIVVFGFKKGLQLLEQSEEW